MKYTSLEDYRNDSIAGLMDEEEADELCTKIAEAKPGYYGWFEKSEDGSFEIYEL